MAHDEFSEASRAAVFACARVAHEQHPILCVVHDGEGDWQFLCDGSHEDEEPVVLCLGDVIVMDPTVCEVRDLRCGHSATRTERGGAWTIVDDLEADVRDNIDTHGWHVMIVRADGDGPDFAYSIGMEKTLGHPEIIVFGLREELMHAMINSIGHRVRAGESLVPGQPIADVLDGVDCILAPVHPTRLRDHFGYALWFYEGPRFRALQCFWPGKLNGRFPWDDDADDIAQMQPDLRSPAGAALS